MCHFAWTVYWNVWQAADVASAAFNVPVGWGEAVGVGWGIFIVLPG